MFQSRRHKDEVAKWDTFAADRRQEADKHRSETATQLRRMKNGPNRDREFERGWGGQRAANQRILDANARDAAQIAADTKKRWWQS